MAKSFEAQLPVFFHLVEIGINTNICPIGNGLCKRIRARGGGQFIRKINFHVRIDQRVQHVGVDEMAKAVYYRFSKKVLARQLFERRPGDSIRAVPGNDRRVIQRQ